MYLLGLLLRLPFTLALCCALMILSPVSKANHLLKFNGNNAYGQIAPWQPSGDFRVIAYLGQLNPNRDARNILLSSSNTNEFLGFSHHMAQGQWGQHYPGVWAQFNFQQTGYLNLLVEQGKFTISDGVATASIQNSAINPASVSYDQLMRRGEQDFALAELQAVILLDLATPQNSRAYGFDPEGGLLQVGVSPSDGQLHGAQATDFSEPLYEIDNPAPEAFSQQDWQQVFPISPADDNAEQATEAEQHALYFDGQQSYAQIPLWQPKGAFRVVAWLNEVTANPAAVTYLLSHSGTTEHISFSHRNVQIKQGNHFPGLWDQFDFAAQKYIDITIESGRLSASDGVHSASVTHSSIQPEQLKYDWLYRRGGGYSQGALQAISLIDLTEPNNSRSYRFDPKLGMVELNGLDGELFAVRDEHWRTGNVRLENPEPTHFAHSQWLAFYAASVVADSEPTPPTDSEPDHPPPPTTPPPANAQLLAPNLQAIQFDGLSDHLVLNWQPEGEHRITAWLSALSAQPDQWHYLLSGNSHYLAFNHRDIKVRLNGTEFEIRDRFAFEQTQQVAFHIDQGVLTVSDGRNQHSIQDPAITRVPLYRHAMRWGAQYSSGVLQSLGLIDYNNPDNTHGYVFDPERGLINTRTDSTDQSYFAGSAKPNYRAIEQTPIAPSALLANQQQWDQQFQTAYPTHRPILDNSDGNDQERFDWEGHYWLRAYLTMARTFNDDKYLDYAIELVDHMLAYTDEQRVQRGELDLSAAPYHSAPKFYLNNPRLPSPSWRRPFGGWRVTVLSDGQILSAIMQVVDHIKTRNKTQYFNKADRYLEQTLRIIEIHDSSYSTSKNAAIPGSYFYINNQNQEFGDGGLYSNPLPYNHSMTMGVAMIYAEKWSNGNGLGLATKINEILSFFTEQVRQSNGICEWDYAFVVNGTVELENLNHAHIDIGFLLAAHEEGYLQDDGLLRCIANTLVEQLYMPPVMLHYDVSGNGVSSKYDQVAIGYDWIALAHFEPRIKTIAQHVLHHYGQLYWFRPYLAWAELMALEAQP